MHRLEQHVSLSETFVLTLITDNALNDVATSPDWVRYKLVGSLWASCSASTNGYMKLQAYKIQHRKGRWRLDSPGAGIGFHLQMDSQEVKTIKNRDIYVSVMHIKFRQEQESKMYLLGNME